MFLLRQSSPKHRMFAPLPCLWGWSPVQDSIRVSITSLLGLLVLSMTFFPSVAGWTHWVGKDDGEWQNTSCCPSYNGIEGFLSSQPLGWTSSPPYTGQAWHIIQMLTNLFCTKMDQPIGSRRSSALMEPVVLRSIFRFTIS